MIVTLSQSWRVVGCAVLVSSLTTPGVAFSPAPQSQAATATIVDTTVRDFYRWYLDKLDKEKEPGSDPVGYARYVSAPLRARIRKELNNGSGEEGDYFTKTQDIMDDWSKNITVVPALVHGNVANTVVTLGVEKRTIERLAVTLVKEAGLWKISRVTEVPSKS